MSKELQELLKAARRWKLSAEEKEEQRRSFAYGNAKIENPRVTKAMVERQAKELRKSKK